MRLIDADSLIKLGFDAPGGGEPEEWFVPFEFIEQAKTIDPKAAGQWMRYDMIAATIRGMAGQYMDEGDAHGHDVLEDLAEYFGTISDLCPEDKEKSFWKRSGLMVRAIFQFLKAR